MLQIQPLLHPMVSDFLHDPSRLFMLVDEHQGAINLLFPQIFEENIQEFINTSRARLHEYKIFYAHKASGSYSMAKVAQVLGINIDVASSYELLNAMKSGHISKNIEATGIKDDTFLQLCIEKDILINVDSFAELEQIQELIFESDRSKTVNVLVRFCNFSIQGVNKQSNISRFGISTSESEKIFTYLLSKKDVLNFKGLSFHIDSSDINDKVIAIEHSLVLFEQARQIGLSPSILNIGGGFPQIFIADSDQWHSYVNTLKNSLLGKEPKMVWNNNAFGYSIVGQTISGVPNFYRYGNTETASESFKKIFDTKLGNYEDMPIAQILNDNLIEVYLEPGKGLLDNVGLTIAKVLSVKTLSDKSTLVSVDIKRDDVVQQNDEVMVDPVLISQKEMLSETVDVYIAGHSCQESDMIFRRKIAFKQLPLAGDLVVFTNTAAYRMDMSSSRLHLYPPIPKLVITSKDGQFHSVIDELDCS